jgi:heat-inducible transcriptional repressor
MMLDNLDRSKRVLSALIREYIASGEPVASSLLVSAAGLGVSSATVRNILARLEDEGYVQQPHTSAGRVPTDHGYRFYVDMLLESKRPSRAASVVEARIRRERTGPFSDSVLSQATRVVSRTSRLVGFALPPAQESAVFDRVEFVPLGANRVLAVIVARGSQVIQKVIEINENLTAEDLRQASSYLNGEFEGFTLARARQAVLERINEERSLYDTLYARAMRLATTTFEMVADERLLFVEGAALLLDDAQGVTMSTLQALVRMIEEKQRLVLLLNECIDGPGLTVVIGAEHQSPTLRSFSLIASTYVDADGMGTTIGAIGPTRMRYSRVIAVVDAAARAVSRVLRDPD